MERFVVARSATLTRTFTFTPTGTPTVTLTRVSDGTTVTTGSVSGAGTTWSYTIPATSNTLLDRYVETWTATTGGSAQTFTDYVEVAGGTLFTLDEARALQPLNNTTTYTDAAITETRTVVEQAIEDEYGTALVPRYTRTTLSGDGSTLLRLRARVRAIRSVTVGASALGVSDLAALTTNDGFVTGYTWAAGIGNIVVGYEYGLDEPPGRIKMDAIRLARQWLVNGPIDDRALGAASPDGGFSFGLATPGRNGSIFGLPDLDAVVNSSPYRIGVA